MDGDTDKQDQFRELIAQASLLMREYWAGIPQDADLAALKADLFLRVDAIMSVLADAKNLLT